MLRDNTTSLLKEKGKSHVREHRFKEKKGEFSFCTLQVKADAGTPTPMPLDDLCSVSKR
jgi:hypothetical protein